MLTNIISRDAVRVAAWTAIAALGLVSVGFAVAYAAKGPACPPCEPCPTCPKSSYWFSWPLGLHGRNPRSNTACGTAKSGPPQGAFFGYYPTCWQRWPDLPPCCPVPMGSPGMIWPGSEAVPTAPASTDGSQWKPLSPSEAAALMQGVSVHRDRASDPEAAPTVAAQSPPAPTVAAPTAIAPTVTAPHGNQPTAAPVQLDVETSTAAMPPAAPNTQPLFIAPKPGGKANDPPAASIPETSDEAAANPNADEPPQAATVAGEDSAD